MAIVVVMILLSGLLWSRYFSFKRDARSKGFTEPWMFPGRLLLAWIASIITFLYFIYVLLHPNGGSSWL